MLVFRINLQTLPIVKLITLLIAHCVRYVTQTIFLTHKELRAKVVLQQFLIVQRVIPLETINVILVHLDTR